MRFDGLEPFQPMSPSISRGLSRSLADNIVKALDDRRMGMAVQPVLCAKTGSPKFYECRLRMEMPDGGSIAAGEFLPVAEQFGLSRLTDRRALELAVDLLKRHGGLTLALSVSDLTCSDREWLSALRRMTGGRRDFLQRMIIEITETAAVEDVNQSVAFVETLKRLGCRVAISGLRASSASLENLKMLNVDIVKIGGAFVRDSAPETSGQMVVHALTELARALGMETVAESVDDERVARLLANAGLTYIEGHIFGQAVDAAELPAVALSA